MLVGLCTSGWRALLTAAMHPDRVLGVVSIATLGATPHAARSPPARRRPASTTELDTYEGWDKDNRNYWLQDWHGVRRVLLRRAAQRAALDQAATRTAVSWAMETEPETMLAHDAGPISSTCREDTEAVLRR